MKKIWLSLLVALVAHGLVAEVKSASVAFALDTRAVDVRPTAVLSMDTVWLDVDRGMPMSLKTTSPGLILLVR